MSAAAEVLEDKDRTPLFGRGKRHLSVMHDTGEGEARTQAGNSRERTALRDFRDWTHVFSHHGPSSRMTQDDMPQWK